MIRECSAKNWNLKRRRRRQFELFVDGAGRFELLRIVEASDGHIDPSWLFLAFPAKRRFTLGAELCNNAFRRYKFGGMSLRNFESRQREEKVSGAMCTRRTAAVRTMANQYFIGCAREGVSNSATKASFGRCFSGFILGGFQS